MTKPPTTRQLQVYDLWQRGYTHQQIADELGLRSVGSVVNHLKRHQQKIRAARSGR